MKKLSTQDFVEKANKETYGALYVETKKREDMIKNAGYKLITIWEKEWNDRSTTLATK